MYELCDMHGHFLPCIDDGSKSLEESMDMLRYAYSNGVTRMFATPHYYDQESVDSFLARRCMAEEQLRAAMERAQEPLPQIALGAEVAFYNGISADPDLEKLCLGNSRYLLLEMPFSTWSEGVFRELRNIIYTRGLIPIIAHLDRYHSCQSKAAINAVLDMDLIIQLNAGCFTSFSRSCRALRLIKRKGFCLIGSDCHSMTSRRPNLEKAYMFLERRGMGSTMREACGLGLEIFQAAIKTR